VKKKVKKRAKKKSCLDNPNPNPDSLTWADVIIFGFVFSSHVKENSFDFEAKYPKLNGTHELVRLHPKLASDWNFAKLLLHALHASRTLIPTLTYFVLATRPFYFFRFQSMIAPFLSKAVNPV
jgi:hypothetical protein